MGSGLLSFVNAVVLFAAGLLLFKAGARHTIASQRFSQRPEFDVFVWITAGELAAAAATGTAVLPLARNLAQTMGWRQLAQALAAWAAAGLLFILGPRAVPTSNLPMWLLSQRIAFAVILVGVFMAPSFVGLMLTQKRLLSLRREMGSMIAAGGADRVVAELLWLRSAMVRFLGIFALVISGAVLSASALRWALLADGQPPERLPILWVLMYGGIATALCALIFLPTYVAWQERVIFLREELYPFPQNSVPPPHAWYETRNDYDAMLAVRASAGGIFGASFAILAPLIGSALTALVQV